MSAIGDRVRADVPAALQPAAMDILRRLRDGRGIQSANLTAVGALETAGLIQREGYFYVIADDQNTEVIL